MRNCSVDLFTDRQNNSVFDDPIDFFYYSLSVFMFLLILYTLIVLVLFVGMNGFEEKGNRKKQFTSKIFSKRSSSIDGAMIHTRRIYRTVMFSLCILVSFLLTTQFIIEQVLIASGQTNRGPLLLTYKYIFGLQIVLGYVFMWVRQRLFYYGSSPLRNLLRRNTHLLALSSSSLLFVILNIIIQMSLAWYWNACTVLYEAITWFILCLLVQGTLLGLFLYPLWTLTRERKRVLESTKGNGRFFSSTNVNSLIRRCLFVTSLYFITDLSITLAIIFNELLRNKPLPLMLVMFLQNINCFTNVTCLICSFRNWKTILFPWKKMNNVRRQVTAVHINGNTSTVASLSV